MECDGLVRELARRVDEIERHRRFASGFRHLEVEYEAVASPDGTAPILDLLCVRHVAELTTELVKLGPSDLRDAISNYDEVVRVLTGTRSERLLS